MCWRDDVKRSRICSLCGGEYYGDLGHRGCPEARKIDPIISKIQLVEKRHGWNTITTREKIKRVREILGLQADLEAVEFLLEAIPNTERDVIEKLEEENPPF